jgi:hypothetical protein
VSVESDPSKCEEPSTYKTFFSEGLVQQGGTINDSIRTSESELYEQVGTKPMSKLARRYGISDVGHAKIFKKHDIPRPSRGVLGKKRSRSEASKKAFASWFTEEYVLEDETKREQILRLLPT